MAETTLAVPQALKAWADDMAQRIHSVVLFGSRAHGHCRPDSDWDIAIIGDEGEPRGVDIGHLEDAIHAHAIAMSKQWLLDRGGVYPGLAYEVASNGITLSGEDLVRDIGRTRIADPVALSEQYFNFMRKALARGCDFVAEVAEHGLWDREPQAVLRGSKAVDVQGSLAVASSNMAEYLAKALCLATGNAYSHTHDLTRLAEDVPEEWRQSVRGLNGHTRDDHVADYLDSPVSTATQSRHRVSMALTLISKMASRPDLMPMLAEDVDDMQRRLTEFGIRLDQALDSQSQDQPLVRSLRGCLDEWTAALAGSVGPTPT